MSTETISKNAPVATESLTPLTTAQSAHQKLAMVLEAERGSNYEQLETADWRLTQYQTHLKGLLQILEMTPSQRRAVLSIQIQSLGPRIRSNRDRMRCPRL